MLHLDKDKTTSRTVLYVALVGNDPAPVYQGLKLVQSRVGVVKKAYLYLQRPDRGYEKKRRRLLELFKEAGVSCTLKEIPKEPDPEALRGEGPKERPSDASEIWVNLTGGSKVWAAVLFKEWTGSGATFFLLESHRPFEPPKAIFLEGKAEPEPLREGEFLSLEDYRRLYLEPEEARVKRAGLPEPLKDFFLQRSGRTPSGAFLLEEEDRTREYFTVHLSRPYLYRDHLDRGGGEMRRESFAEFSTRARRLGGQLCTPVVPIHKEFLQSRHENEKENLLSRWRSFAREHGVQLIGDPSKPASPPKERQDSLPQNPPFHRPKPRATLLLANVSDQVVPLYAAYLSFKPQEVYLVSTPEKREKLGYFSRFFRKKGVGVSEHLVSSPHALGEVEQYFSEVLRAYEGEAGRVHVNLNGGTTAMALGLYRASWGKGKAHYLEGDALYFLEGEKEEVPWEEGDPEELLSLNGLRLEKKDWKGPFDPRLLRRGKEFLERWPPSRSSPWAKVALENARKEFEKLWFGHYCVPFTEGRKDLSNFTGALFEFFVFAQLDDHLKGKVSPGGRLVPLDGTGEVGRQKDQLAEVDGLAFHRGNLWIVECKLKLRRKDFQQQKALGSLGEQLWRTSRILVVTLRWEPDFPTEDLPVRNTTYMAVHCPGGAEAPGGGKVYRFPEELPQAMGLGGRRCKKTGNPILSRASGRLTRMR